MSEISPHPYRTLFLHLLLAILILILAGAALSWIIGWRTLKEFGQMLQWIAFAVMVFGVMSLFGEWGMQRSFIILHSESIDSSSHSHRFVSSLKEELASLRFVFQTGFVGMVLLILGWTLEASFP